jgi:cysteine desulfurase
MVHYKNMPENTKRIYCDTAAATPLSAEVCAAMEPWLTVQWGNAGGIHEEARAAKAAIEESRKHIAEVLACTPDELLFTSGGTESNNMAILGVAEMQHRAGKAYGDMHVVVGSIEHASVLAPCQELERRGVRVTYLVADREGRYSAAQLRDALTPQTVLVSVMYVNNEIGTVYPVKEYVRVVRECEKEYGTSIAFHTDASQAGGWLSCHTGSLGIDLMTLGGQKVWALQGVGVLYVKKHTGIAGITYGGGQECGLRPGTVPVALVVGMGEALRIAQKGYKEWAPCVAALRDYFIAEVAQRIPQVVLNGSRGDGRAPNNAHFSFPGMLGEEIVIGLDIRGIACSTKSACKKEGTGSSVMEAIGASKEEQSGAVRFSFDKDVTKEQVDRVVEALVAVCGASS